MTVSSFEDFDELMETIEKGIVEANRLATDDQRSITYGDYFMVSGGFPQDVDIFGYVIPEDELYSMDFYEGCDEEEIEAEKEMMRHSYERGFRFGRAYSMYCPEGELGDTHVVMMVKISKAMFDFARSNRWVIRPI